MLLPESESSTNHAGLLEPAVWRRFEIKIEFELLNLEEAHAALAQWATDMKGLMLDALSLIFGGHFLSEIECNVLLARCAAAVNNEPLEVQFQTVIHEFARSLSRNARCELAANPVGSSRMSQHEAHDLTGVSRDTIRKASKTETTTTP